ncbi:holin [Bifidobacterium sp. ESL0784]|uniref:holin n=1 Tax=Bifidobacterium sp. ESL0784 TaxID=2983231 RepID=UPI0023F9E15E|nr:holin [Bifidobacterium sp. ESL0784]MDF7641713.1 holin [Bifidobacterium sp. ESL0784]
MTEEEPKHALPNNAGKAENGSFLRWCRAAAVRAVKTGAQTLIAYVPAAAATIGQVDWQTGLGTMALAMLLSILTSIAGIPEVDDGTSLPQLNK